MDTLGNQIEAYESLKCLGFYFDCRPSAAFHIENLLNKVRRRIWPLRHLRKNGFLQDSLVKVYTAMIRPVLEYASVVFHCLVTEEMRHNV